MPDPVLARSHSGRAHWQAGTVPDSPAPTVPDAPGLEHDDRSPLRRRIALTAAAAFTIVTFVLWIYAFFIYDPGLKVDELADRTFPIAAQKVCAAAEARLETLPPANTAKDAVERADVIDSADAILTTMVADLKPLVPEGPDNVRTGLETWLSDWETHIGDRAAYADALRQDSDARFLETRKGRRQVSRAIDGFAEVNRMESCSTPGDVG